MCGFGTSYTTNRKALLLQKQTERDTKKAQQEKIRYEKERAKMDKQAKIGSVKKHTAVVIDDGNRSSESDKSVEELDPVERNI